MKIVEGNDYFLKNGRKVTLHSQLPHDSGFLVQTVFEGEDSVEYADGDPYWVKEIFEAAPTEVHDKRIGELEEKTAALRTELSTLQAQERKYGDQLKRIAKIEPLLDGLEGILSDQHSHYFTTSTYGTPMSIQERDREREKTEGRYKFQLLTLYMQDHHKLWWEMPLKALQRDDTYSERIVYPCFSYEEALAKAQAFIDEQVSGEKHRPDSNIIKFADTYGVQLPADYRDRFNSLKKKDAESVVERLKKELAAAEQKVVEVNQCSTP